MGNLFLSFTIAIGGAIGLVTLSNETLTNKVLPLIPILYALAYQALEKMKGKEVVSTPTDQQSGQREKNVDGIKSGARRIIEGITVERIILGIGVSFGIKITIEILYSLAFIRFTGQSFSEIYGAASIETVAVFMRGDHPWQSGTEGLVILAIIAFTSSFGTGLWIGYTTKAEAVLEGVIVGALVTMITTMTNLVILYRKLEEMTVQAADSMGYVTHVGFVVVITLQVLFYGLWSGLAQKSRLKRLAQLETRKPSRKPRK